MNRYARQEILPEVGLSGQAKLRAASVLVVGAGGLGCPVLQYLAAAGIGRIVVVDPDVVEASNLHRQPLYGDASLGRPKAEAARDALKNLNPEVKIIPVIAALTPGNVEWLMAGIDLVLDCADSYAATYTLSDTCFAARKPYISASVLAFGGYAGGFCGGAPSLRAVFPDLPQSLASCATAGVIGPAVGLLGVLQAQMALAVILGLEPSPLGQLVTVDMKTLAFGGFRFDGAPEPEDAAFPFIAPEAIAPSDLVFELRGFEEAPVSVRPDVRRATVADFEADAVPLGRPERVVMVCRSGIRAWRAAAALAARSDVPIALVAVGSAAAATLSPRIPETLS